MRITGGQWAGRMVTVPPGQAVRPTPDKVRQAIFNSLGDWIIGRTVLELFAGSGALSLECLSRGASSAVCVEAQARHAYFLRRNALALGASVHLLIQDAFATLRGLAHSRRVYQFIIADPPYGPKNIGHRSQSYAQQLLDDPLLPSLLAPDGRFLLGHAKRDQLQIPNSWKEIKTLRHGDTWMRFLTSH